MTHDLVLEGQETRARNPSWIRIDKSRGAPDLRTGEDDGMAGNVIRNLRSKRRVYLAVLYLSITVVSATCVALFFTELQRWRHSYIVAHTSLSLLLASEVAVLELLRFRSLDLSDNVLQSVAWFLLIFVLAFVGGWWTAWGLFLFGVIAWGAISAGAIMTVLTGVAIFRESHKPDK